LLSFFFVIFADLRAFVVALLSGGLVEGAKIVGEVAPDLAAQCAQVAALREQRCASMVGAGWLLRW